MIDPKIPDVRFVDFSTIRHWIVLGIPNIGILITVQLRMPSIRNPEHFFLKPKSHTRYIWVHPLWLKRQIILFLNVFDQKVSSHTRRVHTNNNLRTFESPVSFRRIELCFYGGDAVHLPSGTRFDYEFGRETVVFATNLLATFTIDRCAITYSL